MFARQLEIPYFRGVFMRDKLPKKVSKKESGIINLDSYRGSGTHWVAYMKINDNVYYYDSFGVYPPQELIDYFGEKCTIYANYEQDQQFREVICGHLCLVFLSRFR